MTELPLKKRSPVSVDCTPEFAPADESCRRRHLQFLQLARQPLADCNPQFIKQTRVGLLVQWFAHGRTDEAAFDPADGFSADAALTSQGGRCSNPSLPGVPASASANSLPS
jgi:hypothetical protein